MSALTRILNNQIFSKTIIASQKIADGTITGSLFSSNVTVPGDFLITGNLFVLGSSAYTTIASTNTYVNDPLITLNNGFAGSNTYDEGLIFNRGTSQNRALIWSEFNQEFRLIGTTETGTTYGNVAVSNYANIHVGNLISDYNANVGSLTSAGGINGVNAILSGDLAVNGGDITTAQSMGNVFNANATSISAFGAATGILLGATSGTLLVNNPTIVGSQTTQNIFNANATTVNAFGAATAITIGANSGFTAIQNGNIWVPNATSIDGAQTTVALLNTNATTINAFGAATTLNLGASSGIATVNNTTVYLPTATNIAVGGASLTFANTVVATVNAFGSATSTFLGATGGIVTARDALAATGTFWANSSASTTTQGTGAVIVPNGGISVAGAANIASTLTVGGATQLNSTLDVGGITTFTNSTNATTITNGAVIIQGGASVLKDLYVGGNLYAANIVGITANVITVEDPLLFLKPSYTFPYNYDIGIYSSFTGSGLSTLANVLQHTGVIRHQETNTWTFASNLAEPGGGHVVFDNNTVYDPIKAGNLELTVTTDSTSASTGALIVAGGAGVGGNIFHTGTRLETSASNYLFASTPTTVDAFKAATNLEIGATSGTFTINNPTVVGTQTTQALYNTVADTINFARAANITMGHTDGITTLQGNANVRAVTQSTSFTNGALVVAGGLGVASNLNIKGGSYLTLGKDLAGGVVYPENAVQVTASANSASRISIQNLSSDQSATTEFIAMADNGSNVNSYISFGITSSTYNSAALAPILQPNDGYTRSVTNLVLIAGDDVVIAANGRSQVGVRISASNSNVGVQYSTESTTEKTGAFTVVGGVGIGSDLYVGKGATLNSLRGGEPVQVLSSTSGNVAIFANVETTLAASTEYVVIGGGNTVVQPGVTLKVGSITTMMIPTGPTSGRPSSLFGNVLYDVQGMFRYNTTINNIEFFDGTNWQSSGSTFTVISDRQFSGNVAGGFGNVDGTNTNFTLQSSATTASTIISINGVLQFPTLAYSVTGSTLTFTEPPAPNDVIDARVLTTTSTVASIASGNGLNQFIADDAGAQIFTGTNATTLRVEINPVGDIDIKTGSKLTYDQTAVNITANATPYVIATFSQSTYTSAKYQIQVKKDATNFQAMEALVLTDKAGNAYVTTYGVVNNGTEMGTLSANVLSGNVNLWFTSVTNMTNANVKAFGTYII
jgi:hypothetical protein